MTTIERFDTMAGEIVWDHSFPPPETAESMYELMDFQRACQLYLCSNGDVSVKELSQISGFEDTEYFARIFKTRFGKPPSQYDPFTL